MLKDSSNRTTSALASSLQVINPKLTQSNYRFWSSQVLSTVGSHELEDHLLGRISCPSPLIIGDSEIENDLGQNRS